MTFITGLYFVFTSDMCIINSAWPFASSLVINTWTFLENFKNLIWWIISPSTHHTILSQERQKWPLRAARAAWVEYRWKPIGTPQELQNRRLYVLVGMERTEYKIRKTQRRNKSTAGRRIWSSSSPASKASRVTEDSCLKETKTKNIIYEKQLFYTSSDHLYSSWLPTL